MATHHYRVTIEVVPHGSTNGGRNITGGVETLLDTKPAGLYRQFDFLEDDTNEATLISNIASAFTANYAGG